MANYICKHCDAVTDNPQFVCKKCSDKIVLIRKIKAMLMPYYKLKQDMKKTEGGYFEIGRK